LTSLVDLLAREADVGEGRFRKAAPVRDSFSALAILANFAALMRRVVLVGEAPLGAGVDFAR
jgi:hypothetical protein